MQRRLNKPNKRPKRRVSSRRTKLNKKRKRRSLRQRIKVSRRISSCSSWKRKLRRNVNHCFKTFCTSSRTKIYLSCSGSSKGRATPLWSGIFSRKIPLSCSPLRLMTPKRLHRPWLRRGPRIPLLLEARRHSKCYANPKWARQRSLRRAG